MAAIFKKLHRHATDHQKVISNLIANSDCWSNRSDLCSRFTRISTRNIKKPVGKRTFKTNTRNNYIMSTIKNETKESY